MHQVTRGDRLSCYLPPPLQQPSLLGHVFTKVFAEDCHSLFSGEDQPEYRASQVRQLTYQYTCPASVLHAASLAGLPGGPVSSVSSLVILTPKYLTSRLSSCWLLPMGGPQRWVWW